MKKNSPFLLSFIDIHFWEILFANWACCMLLKPRIYAFCMESMSTQQEFDLFLIFKILDTNSTSLKLLIQIFTLLLIILYHCKALKCLFIKSLWITLQHFQQILQVYLLTTKASREEHRERIHVELDSILASTAALHNWNGSCLDNITVGASTDLPDHHGWTLALILGRDRLLLLAAIIIWRLHHAESSVAVDLHMLKRIAAAEDTAKEWVILERIEWITVLLILL